MRRRLAVGDGGHVQQEEVAYMLTCDVLSVPRSALVRTRPDVRSQIPLTSMGRSGRSESGGKVSGRKVNTRCRRFRHGRRLLREHLLWFHPASRLADRPYHPFCPSARCAGRTSKPKGTRSSALVTASSSAAFDRRVAQPPIGTTMTIIAGQRPALPRGGQKALGRDP